jgi:hypothetical protein
MRILDSDQDDHEDIQEDGYRGVDHTLESLLGHLAAAVTAISQTALSYRILSGSSTSRVVSILLVIWAVQGPPNLSTGRVESQGQCSALPTQRHADMI